MDKILILDFGSQYTQLIARRVRAEQVYCEVHPWYWPTENIRTFNPKGVILSGGPSSVIADDDRAPPYIQQTVLELGVPLLAICYGMQALAAQLGGRVGASTSREYGQSYLQVLKPWALLPGTPEDMDVWMSHGDTVEMLPQGFEAVMITAHSQALAAMADDKRRWYGLQFHPEVSHTVLGQQMIGRFVHDVCGISHEWQMPRFIQSAIANIRRQVGEEQVVLGLSGGVDSSVAAALIHRAIGHQLTCIFVDNGLLRLDEGQQVMTTMKQHLGMQVKAVNASEKFLTALSGVADPEAKRKIIGREFVHVFQEQAAQIPNAKWLAQGTIYPDVIESAASGKQTQTIKSHHNVGGLPDTLHLKLLEPLRMLFKDEVREAGIALGLPREMVFRHPFPGPGLGVRVLGEIKRDALDKLRRADAIFIAELKAADWYDKVAQAFAVFLPVRSVGVMGDGRTYEHVIALRAVHTTDFMTAGWAELPHSLLNLVARRIINEVPGINRVVYDISSKPPATIEWE